MGMMIDQGGGGGSYKLCAVEVFVLAGGERGGGCVGRGSVAMENLGSTEPHAWAGACQRSQAALVKLL